MNKHSRITGLSLNRSEDRTTERVAKLAADMSEKTVQAASIQQVEEPMRARKIQRNRVGQVKLSVHVPKEGRGKLRGFLGPRDETIEHFITVAMNKHLKDEGADFFFKVRDDDEDIESAI